MALATSASTAATAWAALKKVSGILARAQAESPGTPRDARGRGFLLLTLTISSEDPRMSKVVVRAFACSMDGFGAGLGQSQDEPFGKNAIQIMNWFFPTNTFQSMIS